MSDPLEDVARSRRQHWVNHVARHAADRPDGAALTFEGRTTTWAQLQERVVALSGAIARRGVGTGDRVAVLMSNRPEFVELLLAVNRLGAIVVPINFRLSASEIAFILEDSGAALLFVDADTAGEGRVAAAACRHRVTVLDGPAYDALLVEEGEPAPPTDVEESAPALIMYTSGTTGRPKGAVLTHLNLAAQSATLLTAFGFGFDGEVNLCASPLFHIGAIGSVAPALMVGATIAVAGGGFDAAAILDRMERERVTTVFLVPTQWQAICAEQQRAPRDLSRLRVAGWGAAPATDALLRTMDEVLGDAAAVALFGQTEMSPVTCVLEGKDARRKLGSVGRPVPGVTARVVAPDMTDVAPGEIGEIVYRGPGTMLGYWNNPEATAEAFRGGWFHSGDLVRVDAEGFVHVVDRAKDMIISGGENIYCAEVENVLADHPAVVDVAVIGRPHERWGETPVAFVVLRDGASLDLEELRTWASPQLARYKLPTVLELVGALPRNASGKVTKGALRDAAGH